MGTIVESLQWQQQIFVVQEKSPFDRLFVQQTQMVVRIFNRRATKTPNQTTGQRPSLSIVDAISEFEFKV